MDRRRRPGNRQHQWGFKAFRSLHILRPRTGTYTVDQRTGRRFGKFTTSQQSFTFNSQRYSYSFTAADTIMQVTLGPGAGIPEPTSAMVMFVAAALFLPRKKRGRPFAAHFRCRSVIRADASGAGEIRAIE